MRTKTRKQVNEILDVINLGSLSQRILHGPRLLPDKAKFTVCSIIKLATIAFDETSSYWSAPESY